MNKAKEKYYVSFGGISAGKNTIHDYIKELEEQNGEMLEMLIDLYKPIRSLQDECYWRPIQNIIEKIKGKPIEEVMKDES